MWYIYRDCELHWRDFTLASRNLKSYKRPTEGDGGGTLIDVTKQFRRICRSVKIYIQTTAGSFTNKLGTCKETQFQEVTLGNWEEKNKNYKGSKMDKGMDKTTASTSSLNSGWPEATQQLYRRRRWGSGEWGKGKSRDGEHNVECLVAGEPQTEASLTTALWMSGQHWRHVWWPPPLFVHLEDDCLI